MIHVDLTCWWYLLSSYYWRNMFYSSSVLSKAECELCVEARTNTSKEAPLSFSGYSIMILLGICDRSSPFVHIDPYQGGVWKKDFWFEARRKVSCPPAIEQKPSSSLPFFCYACFSWGISTLFLGVGTLCLLLSQRSEHKSPLLCGQACAFVWCWLPLCQWEMLFFCLLSILLLWWGQQFWFLFIPFNHPGIFFYFPFVCFHVRFTSQHSEVPTVAFFKYFSEFQLYIFCDRNT